MTLSYKAPMPIAQEFQLEYKTDLAFVNGKFYEFYKNKYLEISIDQMRYHFWQYLGDLHSSGRLPALPCCRNVEDVLSAYKAWTAQVVSDIPFWLIHSELRPLPDPTDLIVYNNVILNLKTKKTESHTSALFSTNAVPVDYLPEKGLPHEFFKFLKSVWPEDQESIDTLQEMFGLFLTNKTCFQKAFLLIGPKRSGKGTIIRTLEQLLSFDNIAVPTFSTLSNRFGLTSLIDKTLAIITDARLGKRSDITVAIENILRITGEDRVPIDRKNREEVHRKLSCRFLICSNELPDFVDPSTALSSRFIYLKMSNSFFGKEDLSLDSKIASELSEILNWSLIGLERLLSRGMFLQPASAVDLLNQMTALSSPIDTFISDCCNIGPSEKIRAGHLFEAYKNWNQENNIHDFGSAQVFGKQLYSVLPNIKTKQFTLTGKKHRFYVGLNLKPEFISMFENSENAQELTS